MSCQCFDLQVSDGRYIQTSHSSSYDRESAWAVRNGFMRSVCVNPSPRESAHLCSPLPILSLSGVDRNDCLSPCFSVLCELWIELVFSQTDPHSVHPPQSGHSSRSLPSHLHRCYFLCNMCFFSSHYMAMWYGHVMRIEERRVWVT